MISVDGINVHFGNFELFSDISFLVNPRDRIGLTGKNGAGKTTLLRILSGLQAPSAGRVTVPSGVTLGYLPQHMKVTDSTSVLNETLKAFKEIRDVEAEIGDITLQLTGREDHESPSYLAICDRISDLQAHFSIMGGTSYLADTEQALIGLGFGREEFGRPTTELSGGWRMRIELAKILLLKPSVLLLDEPTNHLDIESIEWLESFLSGYPGAIILVSHDRAFLDNITTRTLEISVGRIYDYKVSYSQYVVLRMERREQQLAAWRNQQKMIGDTQQFIERFRYKSTKAVQVQSRIKQLDKLDRIEVDQEDNSSIRIRFAPSPRSGAVVIEAKHLSKSYGKKIVLNNTELVVQRGEKVAFVGRNGEGKTTLSKIIIGDLDYTGHLKTGHNTRIGYYAQNQDELIDESLTVFETIDKVAVGDIRGRIRELLGAFLFGGDDIDKKVRVLSGGERSRLALIKLLLEPYNLLLLDEPTNHLDMRSKDILKQALVSYDGTLIVVSHDRDFLDGLVTKVFEFKENRVKEHIGGIYDFLRKKKIENLRQIERRDEKRNGETDRNSSVSKNDYLARRENEKLLRRLRKQLSGIESDIEKLEKEKEKLVEMLSNPGQEDTGGGDDIYSEYEKVKIDIENKMSEWETLSIEIEKSEKTAGNGET